MFRNHKSRYGLTACIALLTTAILAAESTGDSRPNIVLIMSDDHTWCDVGYEGHPDLKTPNLDRLAKEGMRFNHAYTSTSVCGPTRFQIQSGRYPGAFAPMYGNVASAVKGKTFETLASWLGKLGYRCALSGKRHLTPIENFPYEFLANGTDGKIPVTYPELNYVQGAVKFIERDDPKPFLLVVTSGLPHCEWRGKGYDPAKITVPPYLPDLPVVRRNLAAYYGDVTSLDSHIGIVLDALDRTGKAANTIVIWTSEQGSQMPRGKHSCNTLGLRTAFALRWPGVVKPGSASDAMIQYVDVLPTFAEIAGGAPPEGIDGLSFLPVIQGKTNRHRDEVFGATGLGLDGQWWSVRTPEYSYIWNCMPGEGVRMTMYRADAKNQTGDLYRALVEEYQKLLTPEKAPTGLIPMLVDWMCHAPEEELYRADKDTYELNNVVSDPANAAVLTDMRKRLHRWMIKQGVTRMVTQFESRFPEVKTEGASPVKAVNDELIIEAVK